MQVSETLSEGLKRGYKVVVEAADMEAKVTDRLTEMAKEAQMPGFRPGKVPLTILRRTYGRQLLGEVLEQAVNEATTETLEKNELKPAMQPKIEVVSFDEGKDLEYTIEVEVMPEFEPMDFSTLSLERVVAEISDEEVDKQVESFAQQFKEFEDAEEGHVAENGDTVVIDFKGSVDGELFDGGTAEGHSLELGSNSFIPGFEEQLVGAKKGEEKTVTVNFPDEYQAEHLAGKAAEFACTVNEVKTALPVVIDDAMAEKLGLENLAALKDAMREQSSKEFSDISRTKMKRQLLDALADNHDFEVPEGLVEGEFEQIWNQVEEDLKKQEKTIADLDKPEDEARAEYRGIAERRVRLGLLLSEVGNRNNLAVNQDEVNRAMAEQAQRFPGQEQQIFEFYQSNPEMRAQLEAPIMEDKVVDFIVEMAQVSESKVSIEELMASLQEDDDDEAGANDADADAGAEAGMDSGKADDK
ncbi:MAG: trigger factor [Rhodospirillaceae bacterium]|jgi:trigger factor|nr:trigger factor [Rhodospirillaceae bacterium]MBT5080777.1 trigger factor [Rhodospirillaceae bacterium]MBT5525199.1 trigger factor [Rhodospirillaceae bacterium]MBT5877768.1 trigger factor [Rhodospirillaceae bacterium]MBT6592130.1 trigger factor [Rhodospirillaceae bacterium]